jgi:HSP20 family protein
MLFDDFFKPSTIFKSHDIAKVDIKENDDSLEVIADVPGFSKEEIDIKYEKGWLTLRGEKKIEKEDNDAKYLHKEIGSRSFTRRFYLGDSIETDKIDATFKNGLLTIELPKSEKEKFKQIEIK